VIAAHGGDEEAGPLLTTAMLGIASGAVLVPLNSTMLAVALPSVMETFAVDAATVASLVTLYLAAVAIALPASGSLGDRFGHRRTFLIGVTGFAAASVLAASTTSFAILASARVLQAVSGALVSTSSTALVRAEAPPSRQGAAFGLFDMLVSIAAAIGPLVGGLVVVAFGWRGLFLLAVPVASIAVTTVGWLARPHPVGAGATTPRPLDLPGLALLALTLVAALLAIRGPLDRGLGSAAAVAVIPLAIVFVAVELRADHPAVDPRLLGSRPFAAALIGVFGMTVVLHGCFIVVPLLVERLQSGSPTTAGLVLLGISALWGLVAPLGGRLSDRVGRRRPAVIGGIATAIGLAVLWQVAPSVSTVVLGGLLALVGLGMGLSGSPRQAAAMEVVGADRLGMAAGTYYTGRYLGGVAGASLAGAVLGASVTAEGAMTVFGLLAIAAVVVTVASVGLPDARSTIRTSA
jgi:DHA2 family methylenomycin A resistance protein-like MFS transporter